MVRINKELLFICSENAREKIKSISRVRHHSSQRTKYAIEVLKKDKIIYNPFCIFDYSYFGLILFRVYFKGGYIREKDKQAIVSKLIENPYVVSVYEMLGEFDIAIELVSPNPSRFNKELKKVANLIPTLNSYKMILNIVSYLYPRFYLTKESDILMMVEQEILIGGDRKVETFDEKEMLVMKTLLNDPLIRLTTLAKKCQINVKTATNIMKSLKKRKVIRGFKYNVGASQLNLHRFRLFLKLHNLTTEREFDFMKHMLSTKEIIVVNKTVGDWEMEIDLESTNKPDIRKVIVYLREEFKDIIESFNSIEFYHYYKRSFLPEYIFLSAEQ
ncbi:hypothetical protein COV17_03680 [Candidatus Woesearchaeota archaeon CG10_big_fil_rev_8_21_14_0_10_36_11]|nr:MAG: hypothetical protein COV17_03680 [Candidatus Woesearchaeota archaeon CG10_big_fil_rev_8_21_14_0_10_36_11]